MLLLHTVMSTSHLPTYPKLTHSFVQINLNEKCSCFALRHDGIKTLHKGEGSWQ